MIAVGGAFVDRTPPWLKNFAVSTFGTNDKLALFVSMALVLTAVCAVIGVVGARRHTAGLVAFVVVGAIGALAVATRPRSGSFDILPTLTANAATRVLIFTGLRSIPLLDTAIAGGARGIVQKNAEVKVLLKAIEKVYEGEYWLDNETLTRVFTELVMPHGSRKLDPEAKRLASLTARERKVILVARHGTGAPNKVLAQALFISEHTLRNHLTSIYEKLQLSNRLELYVWALKHQDEL